MAKQRMIVTDDQLLIDMELLFNAIREVGGDWQKVEQDMGAYRSAVVGMVQGEPDVSDAPKQRMKVNDDQLIVDSELIFNAIREAEGKWEMVEQEMHAYLDSVRAMSAVPSA